MSQIVAYLDSVKTRIRTLLPGGPTGVRDVAEHVGPVSGDTIKRYAQIAPCVIIAPTRVYPERAGTLMQMRVHTAAFCLAKSTDPIGRGRMVMALAEAVMKIVQFERWPNVGVQAPTDLYSDNLYNGEIDKMGVALWGVRWRQLVAADPTQLGAVPVPQPGSEPGDLFPRLRQIFIEYQQPDDPDNPDIWAPQQLIELPEE